MDATVGPWSTSITSRPLNQVLITPLAMWIGFSATQGDRRQSAEFAGSMVLGSVASLTFILAAWLGFRQEWDFALTVGFATVVWLVVVWLPRWVAS